MGHGQVNLEGNDVTGPGVDGQIMGVAVDEAGQDQTAAHVVGRGARAGEFKGVIAAAHKADLPVLYHQRAGFGLIIVRGEDLGVVIHLAALVHRCV